MSDAFTLLVAPKILSPNCSIFADKELFPQNYHEPYYETYTNEDFRALATDCGLAYIRTVNAFVSKVMVFDKPAP